MVKSCRNVLDGDTGRVRFLRNREPHSPGVARVSYLEEDPECEFCDDSERAGLTLWVLVDPLHGQYFMIPLNLNLWIGKGEMEAQNKTYISSFPL